MVVRWTASPWWRVKGDVVEGANSTCSIVPTRAGAYLIAFEVQTDKQIMSTQAINLICFRPI